MHKVDILVVTDNFSSSEKIKLQQNLEDRLGQQIEISIKEVGENKLQQSKSEKFKFVISKLK